MSLGVAGLRIRQLNHFTTTVGNIVRVMSIKAKPKNLSRRAPAAPSITKPPGALGNVDDANEGCLKAFLYVVSFLHAAPWVILKNSTKSWV